MSSSTDDRLRMALLGLPDAAEQHNMEDGADQCDGISLTAIMEARAALAASPQQSPEPLDALIDDAFDKMKPFCKACQAIPTHGYCNMAGCPMPRPQQPADGRLTSKASHNRPHIGDSIPRPAYITSGPHLSGYQVKLGYETLAEAQDAHQAIATQQSPISGEGAEDIDWKAEWEAVCAARIDDRAKSQEIINERDRWIAELLREKAPPVPSVLVGEG